MLSCILQWMNEWKSFMSISSSLQQLACLYILYNINIRVTGWWDASPERSCRNWYFVFNRFYSQQPNRIFLVCHRALCKIIKKRKMDREIIKQSIRPKICSIKPLIKMFNLSQWNLIQHLQRKTVPNMIHPLFRATI